MNQIRKLFTVLITFCLAGLFSCQSDSPQEAVSTDLLSEAVTYKDASLVQVDSIMIDVMGNFKVYDYQPESQLFLGGDIGAYRIVIGSSPKKNELGHLVINRQGKIIHQFNHTDRGPEGHGPGAMDNFFMGPNSVGVFASKGLYQYQYDGSFMNQYKEINTLDRIGISDQRAGFSADGKHVSIGFPKGMEESRRAWDSLFQISTPLWFYDFEKQESNLGTESKSNSLIASHGYPDHPIYAAGSNFPHSAFPPRLALNHRENKLLSIYPEIPEITVYDMKTGDVLETYSLEPDYFEFETETGRAPGDSDNGGLRWSNFGGRMANSNYQDIIQIGEYTLLRYNAALPMAAVNKLIATGGTGKSEEWPRFRRKYYRHYYQLFKGSEKVLPDFEIPLLEPKEGQLEFNNHRKTRGKIIGGNGLDEIFVFIPNDGEEERDYELIRVFKLELLEE
ncbi:MAG: hypothetical protein HEP71_12445 [Roseivirga sp.]|nr:hypothetical protein [Roseivirga sp.]